MPLGVARCYCFGNLSLLTVLDCSLPKLLRQLGYCWPQELVLVQRGQPQSRLEDKARWPPRLLSAAKESCHLDLDWGEAPAW